MKEVFPPVSDGWVVMVDVMKKEMEQSPQSEISFRVADSGRPRVSQADRLLD